MAKVPPGATREQFRLMLLADRFKLTVRLESRQVPGYEMTVAKEGTKLKESTDRNPVEGPVPRSTEDEFVGGPQVFRRLLAKPKGRDSRRL